MSVVFIPKVNGETEEFVHEKVAKEVIENMTVLGKRCDISIVTGVFGLNMENKKPEFNEKWEFYEKWWIGGEETFKVYLGQIFEPEKRNFWANIRINRFDDTTILEVSFTAEGVKKLSFTYYGVNVEELQTALN